MNNYTGEAKINLGGKEYTLCYDWAALTAIHSSCGVEAIADMLRASPKDLSLVLLAGLKKHHPELTGEALFSLSPPIVPTAKAINEAIHLAYFGVDAPEQDKADTKKK